jgi:predicted small lipoprotein YifL
MKKLLAVVFLVSLLAACGKKEEAPVATPAPAAEATPAPAPAAEPTKELGKDKEGQAIHKPLDGNDAVPVKK